MTDLVLYDVIDHVALITVNDPERRNAVTAAMSEQLRDAVQQAESDPGVHAVVVTGAGKAFCAGADLSALSGKPVRFRFRLTNGQLFAFWVTPDPNGASNGYVAAGGPQYNGTKDAK